MNRREVLATLLGAPIALGACRRPAPRPVPGILSGAAAELGHRLREPPRGEASETREVGVAIVGGGPSGLSAAWRLERAGQRDFVVLDLEDRAGGTSRWGEDGVVPYPWGAHYVPVPSRENRALVTLLGEIGALAGVDAEGEPVGAEEQLVRAPDERVYWRGRWYDGLYLRAGASADDLAQWERFRREVDRWVAFRDGRGRRAFALPIAHGSDDAEVTALDRESMAAWLDRHRFTSSRLRWMVDYACRDDYGLHAEDTSAWAGLFYFCSRVPRAGAEPAELLAWPEGNGRLAAHLARVAGDRVRTGQLVVDVAPREGGVDLLVLDAAANRLVRLRAEHAIFAAPKHVARHVVRPLRDGGAPHLDAFSYGPWIVANLHLRARPRTRGFPLAWDNVLHDSPSLGYVVATHQRGLDHGPTIFTWYMPLCDADPREARRRLLVADHAGSCDAILADLGRAHEGLADLVERIDVWRWGHAMVQPRPAFVWGGARAKAAAPIGRLRFAHSDLSGVALFEEAQWHGVAAAEAILRERGAAFESWA